MKRPEESASALIDEKIKELGDRRGKTLAGGAYIEFYPMYAILLISNIRQ